MSPMCKAFSALMNLNWDHMQPEDVKRLQVEGMQMLQFCFSVAEFQLKSGKFFVLEHPATASSWNTHAVRWLLEQEGVIRFLFDQCETGLAVDGKPNRKTTAILTNHIGVAACLSQYQCSREHQHQPLLNGRPRLAQRYPEKLVSLILEGLRCTGAQKAFWSFPVDGVDLDMEEDPTLPVEGDLEEELDAEVDQERAPRTPAPVTPTLRSALRPPGTPRHVSREITSEQKRKVMQLHVNMGHLSRDKMLALLKASGAKLEVMKYTQEEFECEACMRQKKPVSRRKAAFPRTFSFNRIVSVDYFFVAFQGRTQAFLNIICHGTNYQQVAWLSDYTSGPPPSRSTWKLLFDTWLQPFGLPETVTSDGGSEFRHHFERCLEQVGVLQIISDAASPWQCGRVERHGAWVKEKAEQEVQSGQSVVQTPEDLSELIKQLVMNKNRFFHRGGYSPSQLVFGANPRVPMELLSDDPLVEIGLQEVHADAFEQDTPAAEFRRAQAVREKARELCLRITARDKVRLTSTAHKHPQRNWAVGQWVYVWRRHSGSGNGHLTRSRWVGPGVVIMQSGHTVWVSMRARLWKCNSDQLRPATHYESVGAELARAGELQEVIEQVRGSRAGAVDVSVEGTPPSEANSHEWVPPPENGKPMIDQSATIDDDSLPEERASTPQIGQGQLLREVRIPAPTTPVPSAQVSRRSSLRTIEEPLIEPPPQQPDQGDQGDSLSRKRPFEEPAPSTPASAETTSGPGRVKRQVQEVEARVGASEMDRLTKEAIRTIRRLDREERARAAGTAAASSSSSASAPATPVCQVRTSPTTPGLGSVLEQVEEDEAEEPKPLEAGLVNNSANFFTFDTISNGPEDGKLSLMAKPVNTKNGEFNMKTATAEEIKGFLLSDVAEWKAIEELGAVKVHHGLDAERIRKSHPHRVLSSRMIRRKKPMPGIGQFKYKPRWCVAGHQDPDTGKYQTFSPMPSVESITMFFQICLNMRFGLSFADIKNAFCQADKLDRPTGPIYVSPCEGLDLPKGSLVELIAPVYGLDDAPLRWHWTLISFFEHLGFTRCLLEPCWLVKRERGKLIAQVLIEVDDLNLGATEDYMPILREALEKRFQFGKFEHGEADFAGRHVAMSEDKISVHQEKYIVENLLPLRVQKGRMADRSSPLSQEEFESFRSLLYKANWVAHQTRPEAAGVVSILASRLKFATIHDVYCLNKLVAYLRSTAQQCLVLHRFNNDQMVFIAASDAGGVDGAPPSQEAAGQPLTDCVQGAWIIMASDRMPAANVKAKVSVLSWRSSKLKRRVGSTLGGEALAFSQALGELEWLQILFRDVTCGDVSRSDWTRSLCPYVAVLREDCMLKKPVSQCCITDAKSLFDSLSKQHPNSRQDRRTAVELAIIIEGMKKAKAVLRWTPHPRMWADCLTKDDLGKSNGALEQLLRSSKLCLWDEEQELAVRKQVPSSRNRSKKASSVFRGDDELLSLLADLQVNIKLGELINCQSPYLSSSWLVVLMCVNSQG